MICVNIVEPQGVRVSIAGIASAQVDARTPVVNVGKRYEGDYTATPTTEPQVFETEGLLMSRKFTVAPIPSNYGLIVYNGSSISIF